MFSIFVNHAITIMYKITLRCHPFTYEVYNYSETLSINIKIEHTLNMILMSLNHQRIPIKPHSVTYIQHSLFADLT